MTLSEIILNDAEYLKDVSILVESNYGHVTITDCTGHNEDIFLQDDDASVFISELYHLYNLTGDLTKSDISLHLAKIYVDSYWN